MKNRTSVLGGALLLSVFFLCACLSFEPGPSGPRDLAVQVISYSPNCGSPRTMPSVTWISDSETFQRALTAGQPFTMGATPPAPPDVDFMTHGVLWIETGHRPTAGYGFKLDAVRATVNENIAIVRIESVAPFPGTIVAQMISTPCIFIRMATGGYHRVLVMDQNGEVWGALDIGKNID